ncbi:protein trichome birefringence-like 13 [Diospyros lotus]|uniref:protein trichome birefringence-like 13 n=1 Tax=Diospyros lotus TaxID=55363 RepID=UPI00224DA158|nr:protein trichome birefringence-like 13 [Diospyros lotus]
MIVPDIGVRANVRRHCASASSMATRDHRHHSTKKTSLTPVLFLSVSLLGVASLFVALSFFRVSSSGPSLPPDHRNFELDSAGVGETEKREAGGACDYLDGKWIYDPAAGPSRYDHTCKEIYKGWNCIAGNKSNAIDIVKWRWKPHHCDLPQFDPIQFLQRHIDTNIGDVRKWRPAGADRGFTFLQYNLTIAYHRTNLLVRYGRWSASINGGALESIGYKEGYRVDVDVPEKTWAEAVRFHDILIFNTGHWWWAPSKFDPVKSPMLFFEKDLPVVPPVPPDVGFDMVLQHMVPFVEKRIKPGAIIFFRTQSPRHFEGGDWDQGGSCQRSHPLLPQEVEEIFSPTNNGTNVETRLVNQHLYKALDSSQFIVLDITRMTEFRADAHPAAAGGKKHDDCMHWCLPGVTDTWNDLFIAHLNDIKVRN